MNPPNDHDILTTLVANLNNLEKSQSQFHKEVKEAFKELKDNYSDRIGALELNKADKVDVEKKADKKEADTCHSDFEIRLRRLETWGFMALGALALLEFYFKFFNK